MIKKARARRIERQARQRHARLLSVAERLVRDAVLKLTSSPEQVTPLQVACLAFARYGMRIDEEEAADYLAAALIKHGYSTDHWPAVST